MASSSLNIIFYSLSIYSKYYNQNVCNFFFKYTEPYYMLEILPFSFYIPIHSNISYHFCFPFMRIRFRAQWKEVGLLQTLNSPLAFGLKCVITNVAIVLCLISSWAYALDHSRYVENIQARKIQCHNCSRINLNYIC